MIHIVSRPWGLALLLLLLIPTRAQAQEPGVITGTVVDEDGRPLQGVNVLVAGTLFGDATGPEGRFAIGPLAPGLYEVQVSALGYRDARQQVTVEAGGEVVVSFRLRPEQIQLEEVEIAALRPDLQPSAFLQERAIREANVQDSGLLLRDVPGVGAVRRGGLGLDPSVRGLTGTAVGTYVDGARFFPAGPLRMDTPLSHFDPTALTRVEVVKGPYALTWGPGNLGALRVQTLGTGPVGERLAGSVRTGYASNRTAFETAATARGTLADVTYRLHGAFRTGDDYEAGDSETIQADFQSAEVRGRLSYPLASNNRLTLDAGYQDQRDIDYPGRLLDADYFAATNLALRYQWSGRGLLRGLDALAYGYQILHEMDNDGKPTAAPDPARTPPFPLDIAVDTEIQTLGGRLTTQLALSERFALEVGGDVYRAGRDAIRTRQNRAFADPATGQSVPASDSLDVEDEVWPDVTTTVGGFFVNGTRAFGRVEASGTVRLDVARHDADRPTEAFLENAGGLSEDDLDATETFLSGALTVAVPLSPVWSLSLGAGTTARPAEPLERYADRFPATRAQVSAEFQGNPSLDPERSIQGDVWIEAAYPRLQLRASAFVRRMEDFVTLEPAPEIEGLISQEMVLRYVNGEATFLGAEASLAYALYAATTLTAGVSYLWGEDETLGEPALGVPPLSGDVGLRLQPFPGFFAEAGLHAAAGQDRVAETRGETETDGYVTADLRLALPLPRQADLLLGLENLFHATYANHLNARDPFTGERLREPGRTFFVKLQVGLF